MNNEMLDAGRFRGHVHALFTSDLLKPVMAVSHTVRNTVLLCLHISLLQIWSHARCTTNASLKSKSNPMACSGFVLGAPYPLVVPLRA